VDGKTDSTIIYYQQAKKLYPINGPYYLGMKLDYNMATESFRRKKYQEAQSIFNDMIVKCQQQNLTEGLAHAYTGLSNVYAESNQLPLAIQASKKAFWLFDSLGLKYDAHAEAENLVGIYAKSANSQEAIKAMNIAKKLNDSIMSVEKQSAVLEIESKYQTDKKEQEIILLKKNASYRQNIIIILIVVALVFFILYRKLKQTNHDLNISQQVLVERYRKEKELRDAEREDDRAKIESLHAKANFVGIANTANTENESSTMDLLTQYFNDAKPYLDPKLKQEDILLKTHISAKALLKLLKEHGFDNFNAFLNSYRVNEAKMLIEMPENNNLKMEVIATKAGFGTRQSFYNAFETNTGLSPAFYRSKMMEVSA
jgi:AraC-like DNA-binding protein